MIAYYTTTRGDLTALRECPQRVCRMRGFVEPHLCFSSEPVRGLGAVVFSADFPQAELTQYEYTNPFHLNSTLRFYALPLPLFAKHPLTKDSFEGITGSPWNHFVVPVLDNTPIGHQTSEWAVLWISRRGVAQARIHSRTNVKTAVDVTPTGDFDPETDSIVLEIHKISKRTIGPPIKETWDQKLVAGIEPPWMLFPVAWKEWVWNANVKKSAIDYIITHCPEIKETIEWALTITAKENRARAWTAVCEQASAALSTHYGQRIDLGRLPAHSFTALEAMPHRMATRMSAHVPYQPWVPPIPQPVYASPETSGRVALANLLGVHPTAGPGIDHRVPDRPHDGREGAEGSKKDLPFRKSASG